MGLKHSSSYNLSLSIIIGLVIACVVSYSGDIECKGMICRGDFPAFYSAAELSFTGQDIYSSDLQQAVQNKYWPSLSGRYLYFSYPPYVASLISPISLLSPSSAKLLFLIVSLCFLLAGLYLVSDKSGTHVILLLSITLSFLPSIVGLISGQNFALSFLLFAIIHTALKKPANQYLAGLAIGIWAFKPHFALIAYLGLFCCRLWKAIAIASILFVSIYLFTSVQYGLNWPLKWFEVAKFFYFEDLAQNGYQMVSLLSYFENLNLTFVGYFLTLFLLCIFYYLCFKQGVNTYLMMLPAVIVLCSPHTMYYDLPLILVPILTKAIKLSHIQTCLMLILASSLFLFRKNFAVSPMIILPFFTLLFNYTHCSEPAIINK